MKKLLIFLALIFCTAFRINANDCYLILYHNEKALCSINVNDGIEILVNDDEIKFSTPTSEYIYMLSDVSKYIFSDNISGLVETSSTCQYSIINGILTIKKMNNPYALNIYSVCGSKLFSKESSGLDEMSIDLNTINEKVIIINLFDVNFKMAIK